MYDILTLSTKNSGSGKLDPGRTPLVPEIDLIPTTVVLEEIVLEVGEIVMTASFQQGQNESRAMMERMVDGFQEIRSICCITLNECTGNWNEWYH